MQLTGKWCDGELFLEHALWAAQVVPAGDQVSAGTMLVTPDVELQSAGYNLKA